MTLPANIAPGRLPHPTRDHRAPPRQTAGGAEFYPSCTQINVGGSQTGTPNQTVSFPGAYSDTDPGILDPTSSTQARHTSFPGGPCRTSSRPRICRPSAGQNNGPGTNGPQPKGYNQTTSANSGFYDSHGSEVRSSTSSGSGAQPTAGSYCVEVQTLEARRYARAAEQPGSA
jgi:hypothetical protein